MNKTLVNFCRVCLMTAASVLMHGIELQGGEALQDPIPSLRGRILAGPAAQGETGSVTSEGADALLYNPAGVIIRGKWDIAFSVKTIETDVFSDGFDNFSYKSVYLGGIWNTGWAPWIFKQITAGLSGYYYGIGGLQRIGYDSESCAPVMTNSNDNGYYDLVCGPALAARIDVPGGDLDLGINAFCHHHQMFGESAKGFPIWDIGIKLQIGGFKSGARLRRIPSFKWNGAVQPSWHYLDTGFSLKCWDMITFSVQSRYDKNEELHWSAGTEWDIYKGWKFRAGYINIDGINVSSQVNKGWTLGGGYPVSDAFIVDVCYHHYTGILWFENSDLSWLDSEWLLSLKYNYK